MVTIREYLVSTIELHSSYSSEATLNLVVVRLLCKGLVRVLSCTAGESTGLDDA